MMAFGPLIEPLKHNWRTPFVDLLVLLEINSVKVNDSLLFYVFCDALEKNLS